MGLPPLPLARLSRYTALIGSRKGGGTVCAPPGRQRDIGENYICM